MIFLITRNWENNCELNYSHSFDLFDVALDLIKPSLNVPKLVDNQNISGKAYNLGDLKLSHINAVLPTDSTALPYQAISLFHAVALTRYNILLPIKALTASYTIGPATRGQLQKDGALAIFAGAILEAVIVSPPIHRSGTYCHHGR